MLQAGFIFSCTTLVYYFLSYVYQYIFLALPIIKWSFFSANFAHMLVSVFSIFLVGIFFGRVSGFNFKAAFYIKKDRNTIATLVKSIIIGLVMLLLIPQVNNVFISILNPILKNTDNSLVANTTTVTGLIFLIFTNAFYPAFANELFFRGVVVHPIRKLLSPRIITIFSAMIFAVSHFSLKSLGATFVMGVIYASANRKTQSLIPPIIVSFIYSTGSLIIKYLSIDWFFMTNLNNILDYLLLFAKLFAGTVLIIILLYSLKEPITLYPENEILNTKKEPSSDKDNDSKFRLINFVSFLPGAFILLMSFMQEINFI